MSLLDGVRTVLADVGEPLHSKAITQRLLERGLWQSDGRTPEATVSARLYTDIKKHGERSRFVQAGKNTFALNPNTEREPETGPAGAAASTPGAQGAREDVAVSPPAAMATAAVPAPGLKKRLSFTDAAEDVLHRHGHGTPMHYRNITAKLLEEGLVTTSGKTPEATLYAQVIQENARAEKRGRQPRFVQHGKGMIGLTEWLEPGVQRNISQHNAEAEEQMLQQLRKMDPADFEQLIGQLLRALGIRDVEVTQYHGDRGIDATGVADFAPGLALPVAVQAKRQEANVQRPVVQALSGSLKPHQQGLIITTSDFGRGAREEAARDDKPLIWLINGQQLVKLLVANDIGARRVPVELVEPTGFDLGAGESGS
jgi:restriction system protein